jgi:hypothetical protein
MRAAKPTAPATVNRRALANQALCSASRVRAAAGLSQESPICIYGLSETLGVVVRFNYINMEGMYQRSRPPRIHLSARRPLPRRNYNCAHELGHHVFGHASSIDELRANATTDPWDDPREFLADTFAGFTLMPILGLRRAFRTRGLTPQRATPKDIFTIACDFGVGYDTLITQLSCGFNLISRARACELRRVSPKALRADVLGQPVTEPLVIADVHRAGKTLDAEVGTLLLLPRTTEVQGGGLRMERDQHNGRLFRAVRSGIYQAAADAGSWAVFIRVARQNYVGLAKYRHLEDDESEQI